ncbi:MAG TPA: AMP-binding protein, partial [Solirubrobacterales bacterium]|nr:AMP-binding protein [Solirubrobacterales bacterium]
MQIEGPLLDAPAPPLDDLLRAGLESRPDQAALISAVRSLSWREVDEESGQLARGYRGIGLEPGDRVASLMPNRIALIVHYLACFRAGLVATPLNYRYTHREIDHALEVSGARALLAHVERAEDVAASRLAAALPRGVVAYADPEGPGRLADVEWAHDFTALLGGEPLSSAPRPDPSAPAAIFFTSGSTGPAKGVTHTRESLRWMIASAAAAFELDAEDVFLPGSSMSHIGSFLWALSTLSAGGRVLVARTVDSHELLPLLREHRPSVLAMIPAALLALIRDHDLQPGDFGCLRLCRSGSDKVSTELLTEFAAVAGFPIVEGYGMTEVGLATLNPPS